MPTDTPNPPSPRDVLARVALTQPDADVAELAVEIVAARIADLPEPDLAALHLAVVTERERRLAEPEVFPPVSAEGDGGRPLHRSGHATSVPSQ